MRDATDPAARRLRPPLTSSSWSHLTALSRWMEIQAEEAARRRPGFRVLDVGCGIKPYLPLFEGRAGEYLGVDIGEGTAAELRGTVEDIPVEDASFDLVVCNQVMEHCLDPGKAVRELRRVVAPGGRVLVSTHGVAVYHPAPYDHWRWTHTGLVHLFRQHGNWRSVEVAPAVGTASSLASILGFYVAQATRGRGRRALGRAAVAGLNRLGRTIDRRMPQLTELRPGTLFTNYHLVADAPSSRTVSNSE